MIAPFAKKIQLSSTVWEFYFTSAENLDYQAGQYVEVRLPSVSDERGNSRTFTLTSLPGEPYISFAVKFPEPCTVYKQALLNLKTSDTVEVSQAMGDLVLPRDKTRPLVFVAGGLGIASFVSMCKFLSARDELRNITLLYALHNRSDELFSGILSTCPGLVKTTYISPNRLKVEDVVSTNPPDTLYYISGSEPFTMSLRDDLLHQNINPTNLAYDFFDGYKPSDL